MGRPDRTLSMRRRLQMAFTVAVLSLVVITIMNAYAGTARDQALAHTRQISASRGLSEQLMAAFATQQAAVEGFADAGQVEDLETVDGGPERVQPLLAALRSRLATSSQLLADIQSVEAAAATWQTAIEAATMAERDGPGSGIVGREQARALFVRLIAKVQVLQQDAGDAVLQARAEFDAASATVTRFLYASLALCAGLLGCLLLLVRRWVLRPLAVILQAVEAVRDGAVDTTIPSSGPPELASLGAHVDQMRQAVVSTSRSAIEAESQLRLLIDSLPDCAIVRLHPDGRPASWSAGAERLTGYTAEQLLGKQTTVMDVTGDDSSTVLAAGLARADAGETVRVRRRRLRADGQEIMIDNALSAIRGDDGQVTGYAVVARDVTAAVANEEALSLANEQLAERATRLHETATLQEATNQDLMAVNQELEAFSYTVSHDLRAPLRAISGFSRLLAENHLADLGGQGAHYLGRVTANASRMSQLIEDLLAFSQLRRTALVKDWIPLAEIAAGAWEELEPIRPPAAVLEIAQLPAVPVDASLIRQVFVNLLSNAIKFSATMEHPRIGVGCTTDPDRTGQPVIQVTDNGIGFDPTHAAGLFSVFARLHTEQEYDGTGIGLSIVERIITRHGGRVWAESTPAHGAVFSFTLGPDSSGPAPPRTGMRALAADHADHIESVRMSRDVARTV